MNVQRRRKPPQPISDAALMRQAGNAAAARAKVEKHPGRQFTIATDYDVCAARCGTPVREGDKIITVIDGGHQRVQHLDCPGRPR